MSAVRQAAVSVLCSLLASLAGHPGLEREVCADLADNLARSSHWARRQTFSMLCGRLAGQLEPEMFDSELLPALLELADDVVPNVRLRVATVLGSSLPATRLALHTPATSALAFLARDRDADVRAAAAAGGRVEARPPSPEPEPSIVQSAEMSPDQPTELSIEEPTEEIPETELTETAGRSAGDGETDQAVESAAGLGRAATAEVSTGVE